VGISTEKELHVLCYEHHTEMLPRPLTQLAKGALYVCHAPDCLVNYDTSTGYILATDDAKIIEEERTPIVNCANDGHVMYLAEVKPNETSFRLWKCPECGGTRRNEEISDGLGKKAGA
jgi:rubrerythrin